MVCQNVHIEKGFLVQITSHELSTYNAYFQRSSVDMFYAEVVALSLF